MKFKNAIKSTEDGVIIDFEIMPNAKSLKVPSGYNQWRRRIEAKVTESAHKGKANKQLIASLAKLFDVNIKKIEIISGATSSKKSIKIAGVSMDEVIKVLNQKLQ
ncbi:MAG: DUF167 domain-containing protein [Methanosarcinales archaeon]